jgi:hypothetical protein
MEQQRHYDGGRILAQERISLTATLALEITAASGGGLFPPHLEYQLIRTLPDGEPTGPSRYGLRVRLERMGDVLDATQRVIDRAARAMFPGGPRD